MGGSDSFLPETCQRRQFNEMSSEVNSFYEFYGTVFTNFTGDSKIVELSMG